MCFKVPDIGMNSSFLLSVFCVTCQASKMWIGGKEQLVPLLSTVYHHESTVCPGFIVKTEFTCSDFKLHLMFQFYREELSLRFHVCSQGRLTVILMLWVWSFMKRTKRYVISDISSKLSVRVNLSVDERRPNISRFFTFWYRYGFCFGVFTFSICHLHLDGSWDCDFVWTYVNHPATVLISISSQSRANLLTENTQLHWFLFSIW